ncbi:MAG: DUF169 domain-containing protein [Candidatus Aureabacteria bacterium]|nr:DUF169 domain-containing protein [Candidatus Auribacterota bacterium]
MSEKPWHSYSGILQELLGMENSPVAVKIAPLGGDVPEKKARICRAVLDAANGESSAICRENNACFGGAWHLGFQRLNDPRLLGMVKKFVVEGEKLFSSYDALETLIGQMGDVPDNSRACFLLSPLEKAEGAPDLVVFVCNPDQACRILTFVTFPDGAMPQVKIGGPTCRLAILYPILTGSVNISFYDYTARKMCQVEKDKLLVSVPFGRMAGIVDSIDRCSAGTAKVEFPPEFRDFLQSRLTGTDAKL